MTNQIESADYSTSYNTEVVRNISPGSICLDVGCWNGNLGSKIIKQKNCTIDGIDISNEMLKIAKARGYRHVYNMNLNDPNLQINLSEKYDVIIFADILEHLVNPNYILSALYNSIKPGGLVIVSLPNVAFVLNRINLALGRWRYTEYGTLDKTHLRFFTFDTARQLLISTGYKDVTIKGYNIFSSILKHIEPFRKVFPRFLSYQILLTARRA